MARLPKRISHSLAGEIYQRDDIDLVKEALSMLNVNPSPAFKEFYNKYAGPFWEGHIPFELLDVAEEERNIISYTYIARKEYGFPERYLVLSEISANAILVLDSVTDKVYRMHFEGEDKRLLQGELPETWPTFYAFLKEYFDC